MRASLERFCEHAGAVRIHESEDGKFGDPYIWICSCRFNYDGDPGAIYLGGFCGPLPGPAGKAGWQAIRAMLKEEGFLYVVWERRKPGERVREIRGDIITGKKI